MSADPVHIGVVADTHGWLSEATLEALAGVDLILHAGDVGGEHVLDRLRGVAPVVAVVGNGDPDLAHRHPWEQRVELAGMRILLCHWYDNFGSIHPGIARELAEFRPDALVYGHTHEVMNEVRDGCLHFNPGYSGPPGQGRPRSMGRLSVAGSRIRGEIVPLADDGTAA